MYTTQLLGLVAAMPHLISAAAVAIPGTVQNTVLPRAGGGDTENFGSGCSDIMVVFARGTTETGNVGTLTGPPFFTALQGAAQGKSVDVQGVAYPADIPGFLAGGDAGGSKLMAQLTQSTIQKCPKAAVVMSGYSQGGQLVHNAAKQIPAATMAKVSSVVIFGDPDNGQAVAGASAANTKVICHTGDNICQGGDLILTPHLTYSQNAGEAASFVVSKA